MGNSSYEERARKCRKSQGRIEPMVQADTVTLSMVCFVYMTQSKILWGMGLRERLSTSGWPVDPFPRSCLYSTLIYVRSSTMDGTNPELCKSKKSKMGEC